MTDDQRESLVYARTLLYAAQGIIDEQTHRIGRSSPMCITVEHIGDIITDAIAEITDLVTQ